VVRNDVFLPSNIRNEMATFIGEYTCRIDDKGRLMLPAAFKKQMPQEAKETFVVRKDIFEHCLVLYPLNEWQYQNQLIRSNVNPYKREHQDFLRAFYKGAAELELDSTNRILIPKRLLAEAGIDKEAILAGQATKIEIWAKERYDKVLSGDDFAGLAEKIMGGSITKHGLDNVIP
jgi:MraZ protein